MPTHLTAKTVAVLRRRVRAGSLMMPLAQKFGVSESCVAAAVRGRTWKTGVEEPPVAAPIILTAEIVAELRRRVRAGTTMKDLAREFELTSTGVWAAVRGHRWKTGVEEPPVTHAEAQQTWTSARLGIKPGDRFGNLVALRVSHSVKTRSKNGGTGSTVFWVCRCDEPQQDGTLCGVEKAFQTSNLKGGKIRSCGCRKKLRVYVDGFPRSVWNSIVACARTRGHRVLVTPAYCRELFEKQNARCALTGWPITLASDGRTASFDRIDNDLEYLDGNVQWVHKDLNMIRGSHNIEYFRDVCSAVVSHGRRNKK